MFWYLGDSRNTSKASGLLALDGNVCFGTELTLRLSSDFVGFARRQKAHHAKPPKRYREQCRYFYHQYLHQ
jgi:hypothetical protein